jgi:hypothetical protein
MEAQANTQEEGATTAPILKVKSVIQETEERTRDHIFRIIYSNSKFLEDAINRNKEIVESFRKNLSGQEKDAPIIDSMEKNIAISGEVFEETIDEIIENCTKQITEILEFNSRMADALQAWGSKDPYSEMVSQLIQENFKASTFAVIRNVETSIDSFRKFTNLTINFNKKIGEGVARQFDLMRDTQNTNMVDLQHWVAEWWKQPSREE